MSKHDGSVQDGKTAQQALINTMQLEDIEIGYLQPGLKLPLVMQAKSSGIDLCSWVTHNMQLVETHFFQHGALLFRNFTVEAASEFERFINTISGQALEYKERTQPRTEVNSHIYTSTEYPPEQCIFLHNESSYNAVFPSRIFFFCLTMPETGGETPIADTRKVLERIDPEIRERFMQKHYMFVRNFRQGFGMSWQSAFQTTDRLKVEEYCRDNNIQFEWVDDDHLRTRQVRRMVATDPHTGEKSWFNHATFFHVSTLPEAMRESLLNSFDDEDLPNNTYYGDGTPIEPEVLDHLRSVYEQEQIAFPWQQGDVLMLSNILVAHGRSPFSGPRKILVGMSEPYKWDDVV